MALLVCPRCRQQHTVRVEGDPERVACGAWAVARPNNGGVEAWVWEAGRSDARRQAFLIDVQSVEPKT